MTDFKIGDVVVCAHINPRGTPHDSSLIRLRKGAVYRVAWVLSEGSLALDGVRSDHRTGVWWAGRFQHLPKADPAFTEQMRAIKPRKQVTA